MRFKIENYYEIKNDGKKKWRKFKNTFFNNKIIQNVKGIDINQVCNKKNNNIKNQKWTKTFAVELKQSEIQDINTLEDFKNAKLLYKFNNLKK